MVHKERHLSTLDMFDQIATLGRKVRKQIHELTAVRMDTRERVAELLAFKHAVERMHERDPEGLVELFYEIHDESQTNWKDYAKFAAGAAGAGLAAYAGKKYYDHRKKDQHRILVRALGPDNAKLIETMPRMSEEQTQKLDAEQKEHENKNKQGVGPLKQLIRQSGFLVEKILTKRLHDHGIHGIVLANKSGNSFRYLPGLNLSGDTSQVAKQVLKQIQQVQ